jgi:hypothetical protein
VKPRRCGSIYRGPNRWRTCGRRARFRVVSPYVTDDERYLCGLHAKAWAVRVLEPLDERARLILSRRRNREARKEA